MIYRYWAETGGWRLVVRFHEGRKWLKLLNVSTLQVYRIAKDQQRHLVPYTGIRPKTLARRLRQRRARLKRCATSAFPKKRSSGPSPIWRPARQGRTAIPDHQHITYRRKDMTDHPQPTPPPWQLVNTVHSTRKHLFCMVPGHERLVATLVSGSLKELQCFKADARLMATSPQLLGALERTIRAMNCAPGFDTGLPELDTGRSLSSYQLLPELDATLRAAREVR
jgi:hypothetical protein